MTPRRTTLLRKGLLIILLPFVAQAALFLLLLNQQRSHSQAQDRAVHTKDVLQQLDGLLELLLVRQIDLRGRLLGMESEEEAKAVTLAKIDEQATKLTASIADNPAQQQRVTELRQVIDRRSRWAAQVRELVETGRREEALHEFRNGEGVALMQTIRAQIATMRTEEERLDRERLQTLRESTRFQNVMIFSGLALSVVVAGLAMWLYGRSIGRRVQMLTANVERLQRGQPLADRVPAGDELGDLDENFHVMAQALSDARTRDHASQQLIERRNTELTRANHELAQKNQENEMFVYSVSHDLRSPLVNLQGFSKELGLVRDDLRTLFEHDLTEHDRARGRQLIDRDISESIRYIQTAVMRLSTIIDALLRLSRAGRVEYQPQRVPLAPVVERIVSAMRDSIMVRKATVNVQELPTVWGDATALEQIFANLIGNAVNYLDPKRPGIVEVGLQPFVESEADRQVFFVRDNGLGIDEAYLPKVFAIFQRLHEKMAPGEGIGLALVRRAVERHGGSIWVESTENVGTTFFVSLPREESSPLKLAPKKESLSLRLPQPTIPNPTPAPHAR